jgi:hypothetical protein
LSIFNAQNVEYLIVGGYAVSFHAQPRATKDIDLLIKPDAGNAKAVYAALAKFGAPLEGLKAEDFIERDKFFRMGNPPVMVDLLPEISGVEDLIAAKLAAGRPQDIADVAALRKAAGTTEPTEGEMD